jgi:hypothetical protein
MISMLKGKKKTEQHELELGLIEQVEQRLQSIKDEISDYNNQAQHLRDEARELQQSGGADNALKVRELRIQADYLNQQAQSLDRNERILAIKELDRLKEEAGALRFNIDHNKSVVITCEKELIAIENEYKRRFERAKEKLEFTKQYIEDDKKRLAELDGENHDR